MTITLSVSGLIFLSFTVSSFNKELVYEAKLREIEGKLEESINLSKIIGLQKSELISILESLYEGD